MVESTAASCNPVIQTRIIILWSELFPKKRREKIQGEILQSIFKYSGVSTNNTNNTRTTVFPHAIQQLQVILHTELILLQEILQLQGSSRADQYKASSSNCFPCLQAFYTAESSHKAPLQHSKAIQHKQASSNSTRQKQHSKQQPASRQSLQ